MTSLNCQCRLQILYAIIKMMEAGKFLWLCLLLNLIFKIVVKKISLLVHVFHMIRGILLLMIFAGLHILIIELLNVNKLYFYSQLIGTQIASGPPTCLADGNSGCTSDSGEWEGEFFPGIPKIKYEVIWEMWYFVPKLNLWDLNQLITLDYFHVAFVLGFVDFVVIYRFEFPILRVLRARTILHLSGTMQRSRSLGKK